MHQLHRSLDSDMVRALCVGVKVIVEPVHGWYDSSDAGWVFWKEKSCLLIFLYINVSRICEINQASLASRTLTRSSTMTQSSLSSSYFLSFKTLSAIILLMAVRYRSTNRIISYVEFHRVTTSWGISRTLRLTSWQMWRQAGRVIVVEWMMVNDSWRTCMEVNS